MSLNKEDLQNLLGFKNLAGLETKIVLTSSEGPLILLRRDDENSGWIMAGSHFNGLFDSLLAEYVGKNFSGIEIKNELLPKIQKKIQQESLNQILMKVEESKNMVKAIEGSSLNSVDFDLLESLKNFAINELNPLMDSPVIQMMEQEYNALSKISQLFKTDYPSLVKKYQDLVNWCNDTLSKIEASSKLNSNNFQVIEDVKSNIAMLDQFRMTHSRKIPDNWNRMNFAKKMFETRFDSADDIISALN